MESHFCLVFLNCTGWKGRATELSGYDVTFQLQINYRSFMIAKGCNSSETDHFNPLDQM